MLSAGDGWQVLFTGRAGSAGFGISFSPSPSATFFASASSTLSRWATMRARIAGVSTLLSSKTKASAMWVCSIAVWLT